MPQVHKKYLVVAEEGVSSNQKAQPIEKLSSLQTWLFAMRENCPERSHADRNRRPEEGQENHQESVG
jgi:hypothetical protein